MYSVTERGERLSKYKHAENIYYQQGSPVSSLYCLWGFKGLCKKPISAFLENIIKSPEIKKQLPKKLDDDIKKQAAIITSMYSILKVEVDKEKALSTVQAIITPIAIAVQLGNFRYAETERSFDNLKKYHEMAISEGPTITNKMEIVESSDEKYHFRVKSCLHMGIYKRLGVPELTQIMCNVDNALYNIYSPDKVVFHRNGPGHTIFEGCEYCEFICENKELKQ